MERYFLPPLLVDQFISVRRNFDCEIIPDRYLATPWLASPHLQTLFLGFWARPPALTYRRCVQQITHLFGVFI
jgi:hypothetical protein